MQKPAPCHLPASAKNNIMKCFTLAVSMMGYGKWRNVAQSVLAAALGVQSNHKRKEDFGSGTVWPYVIGGFIFTIGFIFALVLVVSMVV